MSEKYDAEDWLLDALTNYTALEVMPPDMVAIMKDPTRRMEVDFNALLNKARDEIRRANKFNILGCHSMQTSEDRCSNPYLNPKP
jgi:hypothetical protein